MSYSDCMAKSKYMGYREIAERTGVSALTLRNSYMTRARRNRRNGTPKPGDLPEPDITIGLSPGWLPETVEAWIAARPGQGAGGGHHAHRTHQQ